MSKRSRIPALLALFALFAPGAGCADREAGLAGGASESKAPPAQGASQGPTIVFLGDSLTAGSGLAQAEAYPDLLRERLVRDGRSFRVVNAGVSGDTSAGGLARLDWLLAQRPAVMVVALGANDGLRGLPLAELERNLSSIVERSLAAGCRVLLVGMRVPPNYGEDYARGFAEIYPRVAAAHAVPLVPFLLEGVGGVPALNQEDGVHPTAAGQEKLAETVWKGLAELLAAK